MINRRKALFGLSEGGSAAGGGGGDVLDEATGTRPFTSPGIGNTAPPIGGNDTPAWLQDNMGEDEPK